MAKQVTKAAPKKAAAPAKKSSATSSTQKSGYGQKQFSADSAKVSKSLNTMDSIDKETNKNAYIPQLGGRFMNPGDDIKRKSAQDSLMAAGNRMYGYDKNKFKKSLKK